MSRHVSSSDSRLFILWNMFWFLIFFKAKMTSPTMNIKKIETVKTKQLGHLNEIQNSMYIVVANKKRLNLIQQIKSTSICVAKVWLLFWKLNVFVSDASSDFLSLYLPHRCSFNSFWTCIKCIKTISSEQSVNHSMYYLRSSIHYRIRFSIYFCCFNTALVLFEPRKWIVARISH